jgi:adenylyltransferase/sulfurtransferase
MNRPVTFTATAAAHSITARELAARLHAPNPPHLLDVREPGEHEFVALPGSRLIPLGQLSARRGEIEDWKDEEIVVYCHRTIRSQLAVRQLMQCGFRRVLDLAGGIEAWSSEVDPTLPRYSSA